MLPKLRSVAEAAKRDPKKALIDSLEGRYTGIHMCRSLILVATYIEPDTTPGGIIKPDRTIAENRFQGKVGLLVKVGPQATEYEDDTPATCQIGDWVVFTIKDGVQLTVNDVACRLIPYSRLRMKISSPEVVF